MKFRSTTGENVAIGLTSGHTAVVTPEGSDLHSRFHREAISRGCLPVDVKDHSPAPSGGEFNREAEIRKAINTLLDSSDDKAFNADGRPNLGQLSDAAGFTVGREEADTVWHKVESEIG